MADKYEGQQRGSGADYARYLAGMDASMRQKVALTAAHLLCEGRIADMGTGSGGASLALAQLYPRLSVIGVDVSETMIELATERHRLPNLSFVVGDAAAQVFEAGSLDGILSSSMLHHVTSFGGYDHDAARRAIAVQSKQLAEHGVLVVRDFVDPGSHEVWLDLPANDGDESSDARTCSTASLFERFSTEFRSLSAQPGFTWARMEPSGSQPSLAPGHRRYRTTAKMAAEFVLRKDYRADWESEAKEEYTYLTQQGFEETFRSLGLRVLTSTPLYNPWIIKHRYEGQFSLFREDGSPLEPPPTNYVIVGERVPAEMGVDFRPSAPCSPSGFLHLEHYRDVESGEVRDLVRRPNTTLDVLPWFEEQGALYVLVRSSYPRPILQAEPEHARPLDGSRACPWVVEPLTFIQQDRPIGQTVEEVLWDYARLDSLQLRAFATGSEYYPSPGGVTERVQSVFVQIEPAFVRRDIGQRSGFTSSGRVQAIEAEQLARAAAVGGLSDARLELNVYDLLSRQKRPWGPWLGEVLELRESPAPNVIADLNELMARPPRRRFVRVQENTEHFLAIVCRNFQELNASGDVVAERALEYVMPMRHSAVTASVALLRLHQGIVYMGIEDDDLPAAQCFEGNSNALITPAWRLPRSVGRLSEAKALVRERAAEEYGVEVGQITTLGGKYHPTPGATPEIVHPMAAEVLSEHAGRRGLSWIPLSQLVERAPALRDGHLRISAIRAAHALDVGQPDREEV